jgi:acetamidase/formamidase
VPPGLYGGNLDVSLLGAGSSGYLPVQTEGGLAFIGDPYFAQGDGEVALTAFEAPLRAVLTFDVIAAEPARRLFGPLTGPLGETGDLLVPIGLDADLNEAMRHCVRSALELLEARYGLDRGRGYAYLCAAADFSVSQVVDRVKGIHGRIRKRDLARYAPREEASGEPR